MLEPLDIFIKMEDGTYLWKAAADSFELAKSTVQRLATTSPGEYMIFNQTTGNKTVVKDGLPEPGRVVIVAPLFGDVSAEFCLFRNSD